MAERGRLQFGQAAAMAAVLFRVHVLRRRFPLFVSWNMRVRPLSAVAVG
jgi:hypothetical protein